MEAIRVLQGYANERENLALDAEVRSFSLPPAGATDKLLLYEAHLDRQLYRAMSNWSACKGSPEAKSATAEIDLGRRS